MTNDQRNPKPECPIVLSCALAGFVIRIWSFLRVSSFVIRVLESQFMESPLSFFACIGTMNRFVLVPVVPLLEAKPPGRGRGRAKERRRGRKRRFMESPLSFFRMHWDHEPRMYNLFICKQGIVRFMESLHALFDRALGP